ncbi:MAG: helix-turn-helix transcriptional regulator [Desulfobacteraceae bacterium]|nr:helix-turn-helix transcriptional regulator [Desulfobacteraceae bacterium]MBC2755511.1 helix-turn-helix transcriptional regulator [Desulfobacteraceae bacterium]
MSRTSEILDTLKKYLKAKDITYRQLADEMGLSETSIKRLFSKKTFSLKRLEEICRILDLDLFDLTVMARQKHREGENSLSIVQEQALAEDPKLMSVFYFLINGWSVETIVSEYEISADECDRLLLRLDQLALIELHPKNRVRLLVSKNVFWQKDGPLWRLYYHRILKDFMDHGFELPKDRLLFSPGVLSEASMKIILKQIDRLFKQYNELAEMDTALPLKGRYSAGLFIAFRPWVFSMLSELRKQKSSG